MIEFGHFVFPRLMPGRHFKFGASGLRVMVFAIRAMNGRFRAGRRLPRQAEAADFGQQPRHALLNPREQPILVDCVCGVDFSHHRIATGIRRREALPGCDSVPAGELVTGRALTGAVMPDSSQNSYPAAFSAGASRTTSPWQTVRLRPACLAAYRALSAHEMMSCLALPSSG